jgi:dTDP-4-dehydrorhamnose reductase
MFQPHVVVNCAAMSVPRACELDPPAAMATNVPSSLVNWLLSFGNEDSLLIQLSTDQGTVLRHFFFICGACMYILDSYASPVLIVYEGVKSFYKEEDETMPVNMYGKSKVAAEKLIVEKCSNYAILRSSIIYGPQTISPVAKSLPIQVKMHYSLLTNSYAIAIPPPTYKKSTCHLDTVDGWCSFTRPTG